MKKHFQKIKANPKAIAVKLCDRISNVREARESGSKMLKMYRKEHLEFYTNLYDGFNMDPYLQEAWEQLVKSY